ncbi:MAG: hypothetical protein KF716_16730 [Anaerolineae bacterium]|nr:hypothetical protein [Anaerolineae bacterium]
MTLDAFVWLVVLPLAASPFIYLAGRLFAVVAVWEHASLPPHAQPSGGTVTLAWPRSTAGTIRQVNYARWSAVITLILMWIAFGFTAYQFSAQGVESVHVGMVTLRFDGLSLLLSATVVTLSTFVILFSGVSMAGEVGEEKYYALLLTMTGSMIGLACAGDLFNLWVWFELMAVSSYLLVAFYREQAASLEAGVKYLVQSAVGSALILLGIALVLAQTGSLAFDQIRLASDGAGVLLAAGALFLIGFGVKIAIVPMHTWLPDAHAHAPSGISAILSGVVIEAGLVALLRALGSMAGAAPSWGTLLMTFGVLNMCVGNLMALRQTQVKRLLAFSSVAQIGYMLLGLGIGIGMGQPDGAQGGLFHLLTHSLMKGLAFLAAGGMMYALFVARGDHHRTLTTADLAGAAQRYPITAFAFSVAVLGLGGLPPLAGFMSKWQIFTAGFETQNAVVEVLVVIAALNSVLSLAYYAPLVNLLYRKEPSEAVRAGEPMPITIYVPLAVMAVVIVVIGVSPSLVNWLTGPAGAAVMTAFGH